MFGNGNIPEETYMNIFRFFESSADIRSLSRVNRLFNRLANDDKLWKGLINNFFGNEEPIPLNTGETYQELYRRFCLRYKAFFDLPASNIVERIKNHKMSYSQLDTAIHPLRELNMSNIKLRLLGSVADAFNSSIPIISYFDLKPDPTIINFYSQSTLVKNYQLLVNNIGIGNVHNYDANNSVFIERDNILKVSSCFIIATTSTIGLESNIKALAHRRDQSENLPNLIIMIKDKDKTFIDDLHALDINITAIIPGKLRVSTDANIYHSAANGSGELLSLDEKNVFELVRYLVGLSRDVAKIKPVNLNQATQSEVNSSSIRCNVM